MAGGPINKRFGIDDVVDNSLLYVPRIRVFVAYVGEGKRATQKMVCANRSKLEATVSNMSLVKPEFDVEFRDGVVKNAYDDVIVEDFTFDPSQVSDRPYMTVKFGEPIIKVHEDEVGVFSTWKIYTAEEVY